MAKQSITIGVILTLIGTIGLAFWLIEFSFDFNKNPTNPKHIETISEKMVDEAIPPQINIISKLSSLGEFGALLIIVLVLFWSEINRQKISFG